MHLTCRVGCVALVVFDYDALPIKFMKQRNTRDNEVIRPQFHSKMIKNSQSLEIYRFGCLKLKFVQILDWSDERQRVLRASY